MTGSPEIDVIIRIILSCILGGLIGLERESLNKSAGFRTHILVCVGSALIMIVSQDMYYAYQGSVSPDPGRIAAQVVSGIGFLGAGTIMREGVTVKGLTTAASLWVVAGVGLAVGAGFYFPALITTGVVFLTLIYLGKVERLMSGNINTNTFIVIAEDAPEQIGRVSSILGEYKISILNLQINRRKENGTIILRIETRGRPSINMNEVVFKLSELTGIHNVEHSE